MFEETVREETQSFKRPCVSEKKIKKLSSKNNLRNRNFVELNFCNKKIKINTSVKKSTQPIPDFVRALKNGKVTVLTPARGGLEIINLE